jgi:type I restriction enzyme M protein
MFVQTEKFIWRHDGRPDRSCRCIGQELNESTWRMAKMNLAIHGLNRQRGPAPRWGDTFSPRLPRGRGQMDFVMANPPFNIKDWNRRRER